MGTRGPKPGFRRVAKAPVVHEDAPALSAADRENPGKLDGEALRELAYRRGLARSNLVSMSDEKIRRELNFIIRRQYEEAA